MLLNCGVEEDSWESLECKEIKSVNPEGNQSWIFIGRTDAEAEAPILWPSDEKNWLTGKDPDAAKDWRWEKGTTEDEMVDGISDFMDMSLSKLQELVMNREAWHAVVRGVPKSRTMTEQLNWTDIHNINPIRNQHKIKTQFTFFFRSLIVKEQHSLWRQDKMVTTD